MDIEWFSPASEAVSSVEHPEPAAGGPCATCAFRRGSEASQTPHTMMLAQACVEGIVPFHCHEQPQLCRGFIAAVNLRGAPETADERRWKDANAMLADVLSDAIQAGVQADIQARNPR